MKKNEQIEKLEKEVDRLYDQMTGLDPNSDTYKEIKRNYLDMQKMLNEMNETKSKSENDFIDKIGHLALGLIEVVGIGIIFNGKWLKWEMLFQEKGEIPNAITRGFFNSILRHKK